MEIDGYRFMTDGVTKFFNTVRVNGWFHHPHDALAAVTLHDPHIIAATAAVGLPHGGVLSLGPDKGFALQVLRDTDDFDFDAELQFTTRSGWSTRVRVGALADERLAISPTASLMHIFQAEMDALPAARMLDIGGRARSGLSRRDLFTTRDFVVFDVIEDPSVDVVGDAHTLASHFPDSHFDGILSVSVFEHLMMPWVVATQMNRVLRPGGLALVFTHQTLGMHDAPWDFWRFSDTAWDGLFNVHTGFEIVARALDGEQYVVPFVLTPGKIHAERAAGYEGSAVLVRKIGPCRMNWPLAAADISATIYPTD